VFTLNICSRWREVVNLTDQRGFDPEKSFPYIYPIGDRRGTGAGLDADKKKNSFASPGNQTMILDCPRPNLFKMPTEPSGLSRFFIVDFTDSHRKQILAVLNPEICSWVSIAFDLLKVL
jgi:hypothetical protein